MSGNGRWPTNVILDDEAAALLDAQSGERGRIGPDHVSRTALGRMNDDGWQPKPTPALGYGDSGGASRFYQRANSRAEVVEWLTRLVTPPGGVVLYLWIAPGSAHPGAPTPSPEGA